MGRLIAEAMQEAMQNTSWIRRMFEQGAELKAKAGAENVLDFSLGNPILEPPPAFKEALRELSEKQSSGLHRYLPNAGLPEVRAFIGAELAAATGLAYGAEQIVMTCGAAGGINIILKALLDPGDEVVAFAPYFVEYDFYALNHGGRLVRVETDEQFQIDPAALEAALTPRTRVVLINSPNNPTGVIYPQQTLLALAQCLKQASERYGRPIVLVSDEPYRRIVFDGAEVPWLPPLYPHTIIVSSHSKDLGLAGERVGYVATHPDIADASALQEALVMANRVLGFVNAPALVQRILPLLRGKWVDLGYYQRMRDLLLSPLQEMGYEIVPPQGAFYLFPRAPIADDIAFVQAAQNQRLLLVPGSGFGRPGHFRISFCVEAEMIQRALPVFAQLLEQAPAEKSHP